MSKSQHWYDKDGNAVFEVAKAKGGGMRATTIADARKLNLYPSVTTVLSVLSKPSLDDWKLQQVAERAYSNPPQDNEDAASSMVHLSKWVRLRILELESTQPSKLTSRASPFQMPCRCTSSPSSVPWSGLASSCSSMNYGW
jgi:hypothetical protein